MRIAIFTEVFLPKIDGVVTRLLGTVDELAALGHEAVIFAPGHPPARYAGFRVHTVRSVAFKPWYPELRVGLPTHAIAETMEKFQPHVVHSVNPVWLAAYGAMAAKRRDLPMLASFHTNVPQYTQRLGLEWITDTTSRWVTWLHNLAEVNVCTSAQMVDQAKEAGIQRVELWPKSVDTDRYSPGYASTAMRYRLTDGHPEAPLLIYVGRMSKEKDLEVLCDIFEHVPPGTRLAMVGSGPYRAELEQVFAGTPTVFTGYMSGHDLATAYASADVFVFPSTTETLGLVALESLASGVPVVGARAGGIPYAVDDGQTGLLFSPGDTKDLGVKVNRLLCDESLRKAMGNAGREVSLTYSWRSATEKLVEYYELAITRHWENHAPPGWKTKLFGKPMPRAHR